MPDQNPPLQQSIFPTRDSVEDVVSEALAQLPITSKNQMRALLSIHQNTVISELEKHSPLINHLRVENSILDGACGFWKDTAYELGYTE